MLWTGDRACLVSVENMLVRAGAAVSGEWHTSVFGAGQAPTVEACRIMLQQIFLGDMFSCPLTQPRGSWAGGPNMPFCGLATRTPLPSNGSPSVEALRGLMRCNGARAASAALECYAGEW